LLFDFGLKHWSQKAIPWDEVRELCLAQTRLRVVLLGATAGDAREAVRLLEQIPNFYLETHALPLPDLYERLATAGHSGKVLFGTGMPRRAGECAASQIRMAGVSQRELIVMGGGNARRLLHLQSSTKPSTRINEIGSSVEAPEEPVRVVDVHTHIGSWERVTIPLSTAEGFIQSMDRCGIHQIIFSSFSAIHGEQRLGNQEAALEAAKFPNRLYAYCAINPHYPGEIEGELRICFEESEAFVGLKFHCGLHAAQLHHPGYERALGYAHERNLPVLVHGGGADRWTEICERYPGAPFIMAHACAWDGRDEAGRETYKLAQDIENLYLDVSGSPAHRGAIEALVGLAGEEKILYGSDFPMFDFGFEVGRVTGSHLSPSTQRRLLEGNARRLFRSLA
jgi:predicted TIM-barrel fold metal-dependent hydrolase